MHRIASLAALCGLVAVSCAPRESSPPADGTVPLSPAQTRPDWLVRADSIPLTAAGLRALADLAATGDEVSMAATGMGGLPGLGSVPVGTSAAAGDYSAPSAVVPPDSWEGLQSIGPFLSSTTSQWPTRSLDFRIHSQLHPSLRDPANEWIEMVLATVDEEQDYFEPAYVQRSTGIHFGVDFLHDRVTGREQTWVTSAPLLDPHGLHTYRLTIDGNTGEVALFIDDELFESTVLPAGDFHIVAPPEGHALWLARRTIGVEWMELRDGVDGTLVHAYDVAGSADGALQVITGGETWNSVSGMVVAPWSDGPRIISSGTGNHEVAAPELLDIGESDSFTWAARWRLWGSAAGSYSGAAAWWHRCGQSGPLASPGWGFAASPALGLDYGFAIGDGDGALVTVDAGEVPATEHVVAVRLDRADDSLSIWIDGERVDSADAVRLGAVQSDVAASVLSFGSTGDARWLATWGRALSDDELRSISQVPPG